LTEPAYLCQRRIIVMRLFRQPLNLSLSDRTLHNQEVKHNLVTDVEIFLPRRSLFFWRQVPIRWKVKKLYPETAQIEVRCTRITLAQPPHLGVWMSKFRRRKWWRRTVCPEARRVLVEGLFVIRIGEVQRLLIVRCDNTDLRSRLTDAINLFHHGDKISYMLK